MLNFDELQILHEALRHQLQPSTKARKSSLTVKEKNTGRFKYPRLNTHVSLENNSFK